MRIPNEVDGWTLLPISHLNATHGRPVVRNILLSTAVGIVMNILGQ